MAAAGARTIELHGQPVNYIQAGRGPVVLLIHGITSSSSAWASVLPGLAKRHTVIAPDLPGHGASAKPRGDYSLGSYASGIRDLLVALGHERVTLVGHSLGGGIAMQFVYQFPEMLERLVLVSSGGLGREVSIMLRAATLPGSEYVLALLSGSPVRTVASTATGLLSRVGLAPGNGSGDSCAVASPEQRYRLTVARDEHRERARRAQQLANQAREHAGAEREAAQRSERMMLQESDPRLLDVHRRAAALHRQALQHYEDAAEFQQLHAEHELRAAERAGASDGAARDAAADRRDVVADEREQLADVRDQLADRRERIADERDDLQDGRDGDQDERERRYDEVSGHPAPGQAAKARSFLRRVETELERARANVDRTGEVPGREQAAINRESATTTRREPSP